MLTIMFFAAATAILPSLLDSTTPVPVPLTHAEEDVRAAKERTA